MSLEWMLIRGSGLVAFVLLAGATIWGLVLSLGVLSRSTKSLTFVHESLSVGALLATIVHMVALYTHDFLEFDAADILVPGRSEWRPLAVAWGIVAFYAMVLVIVSFYMRKRIGQRQWRLLHFLSYGVFLGALVHGLAAGTDSAEPVVLGIYIASAAVVVGLTAIRLAVAFAPVPERKPRTRPAGQEERGGARDPAERAARLAAIRAAATEAKADAK